MVEGQGAAPQQELTGQPQGHGADVVELEYRPTVRDLTSALRARRGVSKAGRRQFWVLGGAAVVVALEFALVLSGQDASTLPVIWLVVFAPLFFLSPWLQARQVQRFAEVQGTFRVTVTDAGVTVATDNTTMTLNWVAQPRYRETADIFVMFSPDKNAVGFTVLPKRAVRTPEDVDRLRAILDRNLTRV
ncbi:YcxB family protein [Streptomyces sp. NBC_00151]|uniref:YcxB family protein n=1 Tax=Streptomyces sp. NBC_00151 TaxID=2975669 RepID=UPI002DDC8E07|nr:YcxB family protein [Streptomyces sp. NBC_00151]WRZ41954.1 YcxB family protein [Streptomyces sp. NBC_00151]